MFDHTSQDLGVVARGAKVEHRFTVENNNEEDIRIESVKSGCGCTTAKVTKQVFKSWEKAEIVVTLDTRTSRGGRTARSRSYLPRPSRRKSSFTSTPLSAATWWCSRGPPSSAWCLKGWAASRKLKIGYAGRPNWRIAAVECANPNVEAVAVETGRTPTLVNYDLTVDLKKDAPPGYLRDQLVLVTDDFDARHSAGAGPGRGAGDGGVERAAVLADDGDGERRNGR